MLINCWHASVYFVLMDFVDVRQDRFYTTDYTPEVYTEWGFQHTKSTVLVDLANRHLGVHWPRSMWLGIVPGATQPPGKCCCCCSPVSVDKTASRQVRTASSRAAGATGSSRAVFPSGAGEAKTD